MNVRLIFIIYSEEFSIYLNYVRKLGFEETPDYEFLRELFSKVLKNMGEVDDQRYDWNELNGGRGWEASVVRHICLTMCFIVLMPVLCSSVTKALRLLPQNAGETSTSAATTISFKDDARLHNKVSPHLQLRVLRAAVLFHRAPHSYGTVPKHGATQLLSFLATVVCPSQPATPRK